MSLTRRALVSPHNSYFLHPLGYDPKPALRFVQIYFDWDPSADITYANDVWNSTWQTQKAQIAGLAMA